MERRRQQRKACVVCRRRKVRCDITLSSSGTCSVCARGGFTCVTQREWAPARRGRQQHSGKNSQRAPDVTSPAQGTSGSRPSPASEPDDTIQQDAGYDTPDGAAGRQYLVEDPASEGSEELARTALTRFFNDHVDSEWWKIFQTSDNFRIAYIGTNTSNLAHLLGLRHFHRTLGYHLSQVPLTSRVQGGFQDGSGAGIWAPPPGFEDAAPAPPEHSAPEAHQSNEQESLFLHDNAYLEDNRTGQPTPSYLPPIHHPFPPIRPLKEWTPNPFVASHSSQNPAQDLCMFPAQEVRQALVLAYFKHIHPLYPIIPISVFLRPDGELQHKPPLLLFQAVLLAGAHVCTHPLVAKDRLFVKSVLFRRASMLFHLRHETARLQLAQAAVLFTWHVSDGDTVASGPWYWNGIAMRIACGLGLHRADKHLPVVDRIINKRLWWSIFVAETFSALETGRPCSIRLQDFDQDMLREDDFVDEQDIRIAQDDSATGPSDQEMPLRYHVYMAELAIIILDVLEANSPASKHKPAIASINSRLAVWALRSNCSSGAQSDDFYANHLRIHYNLVIMHLNRAVGGQTTAAGRDVCSMASETILSSLDRIVKMGEIRRCHFSVVGAVTAAGIQLVQDLRVAVASQSFISALNLSERLTQLSAHGDSLAEYWPNAAAVTAVFRQLQHEYEQHVSASLNQAQPENIAIESPDWDSLFTMIHVPAYASLADHEWLGTANLTDLSQDLSGTVNSTGPSV